MHYAEQEETGRVSKKKSKITCCDKQSKGEACLTKNRFYSPLPVPDVNKDRGDVHNIEHLSRQRQRLVDENSA